MSTRLKTGGRKAGTPNRKTREIGELLESLGCNPIEGMVRIAMDPKASLELRGKMNAELATYLYPKRRAVEHSGPNGDAAACDLRVIVRSVLDPPPAALPEPQRAWIARSPVDKGETRS